MQSFNFVSSKVGLFEIITLGCYYHNMDMDFDEKYPKQSCWQIKH